VGALAELGVRELLFAVNHADLFREQSFRPIAKLQRAQWDKHVFSSSLSGIVLDKSAAIAVNASPLHR